MFNGVFGFGANYKFNLTYQPEEHTRWVQIGQNFHGLELLSYDSESQQLSVSWEQSDFVISLKAASTTAWSDRQAVEEVSWQSPKFDQLSLTKQWDIIENYPLDSFSNGEEVVAFQIKRNQVIGKIRQFHKEQQEMDPDSGQGSLTSTSDLPFGPNPLDSLPDEAILGALNQSQLFDPRAAADWKDFEQQTIIRELTRPRNRNYDDE